jgi:hypothetical protein
MPASHGARARKVERDPRGRTHQSYTVGLLGPTVTSGPSETLGFRRKFLQPSPLGVVAAPQTQTHQQVRQGTSSVSVRFLTAFLNESCTTLHWENIVFRKQITRYSHLHKSPSIIDAISQREIISLYTTSSCGVIPPNHRSVVTAST